MPHRAGLLLTTLLDVSHGEADAIPELKQRVERLVELCHRIKIRAPERQGILKQPFGSCATIQELDEIMLLILGTQQARKTWKDHAPKELCIAVGAMIGSAAFRNWWNGLTENGRVRIAKNYCTLLAEKGESYYESNLAGSHGVSGGLEQEGGDPTAGAVEDGEGDEDEYTGLIKRH